MKRNRVMKEIILDTVKWLTFGALATAVVVGLFSLLLAMPNILAWVAGWLGAGTTWAIFIGAVLAYGAWCLAE